MRLSVQIVYESKDTEHTFWVADAQLVINVQAGGNLLFSKIVFVPAIFNSEHALNIQLLLCMFFP